MCVLRVVVNFFVTAGKETRLLIKKNSLRTNCRHSLRHRMYLKQEDTRDNLTTYDTILVSYLQHDPTQFSPTSGYLDCNTLPAAWGAISLQHGPIRMEDPESR